jgi:hypothetical protein
VRGQSNPEHTYISNVEIFWLKSSGKRHSPKKLIFYIAMTLLKSDFVSGWLAPVPRYRLLRRCYMQIFLGRVINKDS